MNAIEQAFEDAKNSGHNISGHLETLRSLASECNHVTEFGVDKVTSTYALLLGAKVQVISYDPRKHPNVDIVWKTCCELNYLWSFIKASDLEIEIAPTDMLFIDSWHTGDHLQQELKLHADKVKKYIVLHDTVTFGKRGSHGGTGLWWAVEEFVKQRVWRIKKHYTHCHGLTVLERVNPV